MHQAVEAFCTTDLGFQLPAFQLQELKGMQFQEQEESVQITLLQSIAALGAHFRGANAELLVLVGLLGRIGDTNACMTAIAAELLLGEFPTYE